VRTVTEYAALSPHVAVQAQAGKEVVVAGHPFPSLSEDVNQTWAPSAARHVASSAYANDMQSVLVSLTPSC